MARIEGILRADVSGAASSTTDALFGVGSVILGAVLIISFFLMSDFARRKRTRDYIDMRPSDGRLLFDQTTSQPSRPTSHRSDRPSSEPEPTVDDSMAPSSRG